LDDQERAAVIAELTEEDHAELSVVQTYWRAFDAGRVAMSLSSFYRVARAEGLVGDRRRGGHGSGLKGSGRAKPVVAATGVNQLWSWDISELPGPGRRRFHLFLAIDVFSRYPVAWRVETTTSRGHAVDMFTHAFAQHGLPATLHSDNGAAMRSHDLADLLADTVTASFSRPHVSDDNPFSEALFKTIKYDLAMPDHFDDLEHARHWINAYLDGYARNHRHSGIGHYTPEQVFTGQAARAQAARQAHLDAYHQAHPERFRKPPKAPALPAPTGINLSKAA